MADDDAGASRIRPPLRSRGRRVPAWVVVPLAALAGWAGAGWLGAALGAVAGVLLWRSRR